MKLATNSDRGVITTTASAMSAFSLNMNTSVPSIVMTPVKSCVNPRSRPSANVSTSAMTRLTISPDGFESIYASGSIWSFANAALRISRTTSKVMRLLTVLMSHWSRAVARIITPVLVSIGIIAAKSTFPASTMQSIASPTSIGT